MAYLAIFVIAHTRIIDIDGTIKINDVNDLFEKRFHQI
jgi:hypothetical protein